MCEKCLQRISIYYYLFRDVVHSYGDTADGRACKHTSSSANSILFQRGMIQGLLRSATHKIGMKDSGALDHDRYFHGMSQSCGFLVERSLDLPEGSLPNHESGSYNSDWRY